MKSRRQRGFSLLEMIVSLAILSTVLAVVLQGVVTMQSRNSEETNKVDLTQQSREFMDQIVNDLRQSGYPRSGMFDPTSLVPPVGVPQPGPGSPANCAQYFAIACGVLYLDANNVQFEADVDGTGVSEEWIQLVQTNGVATPCQTPPCVIQRGTLPKSQCTLTPVFTCPAPIYYTEVNGVMNTNGVFTAYDNNGNNLNWSFPITNATASGLNLRAIGITLYLQSQQPDPQTHAFPTVTMVSTARVND